MKRVILVLAAVLLFSSCNHFPLGDKENLQAPMMNQMQAEIHEALSKTLNINQIVYKYPQMGEYRSPFVFADLDGDSNEEVIVFFAYQDNPGEIIAKILGQQDGQWRSLYDIPGRGTQVEFIRFSPMLTKDRKCIVVGWGGEDWQSIMTVHRYEGASSTEILEEYYRDFYLGSSQQDGLEELVLAHTGNSGFQISLFGLRSGSLRKLHEQPLYEETTNILQMKAGKLDDGRDTIYIDEEMSGPNMAYSTEVFALSQGRLAVIAGSLGGKQPRATSETEEDPGAAPVIKPAPEAFAAWDAFAQTFRRSKTVCTDLGVTGDIKIPRIKEDTVPDRVQKNNAVVMMEFLRYQNSSFVVQYTAAVNTDAGYVLFFPERWIDAVTVVRNPQKQEWTIYKLGENGGQSTALFQIRMVNSRDYTAESSEEILLATRGLFHYYGSIPTTINEPLAITRQEALTLFTFL